jgi:hypothetical protein
MCMSLRAFFLLILCSLQAPFLAAQASSSPCSDAAHHLLDFWVGWWDVYNSGDGTKAGTSTIEKTMNGCAIVVDWHEADQSSEIREVFYYVVARKAWQQLWISDRGATKERHFLDRLPDGTIRFLGEITRLDGGTHLDRSTVTPLPNHRVHQLIEISRDDGKTWQPTFEGEYRAAGSERDH